MLPLPSDRRVINKCLTSEVAFVIAILSLMVIVLGYTAEHNLWGDLYNYYINAGDVLNGLMPYSEMRFEYPPFALTFMLIPRLLTQTEQGFFYASALLSYLFFALGIVLLIKIADENATPRWRTYLIVLGTLIFTYYFIVARNDVYPTVMVIAAVWLYMKKHYDLAFAVMALGAMTKIYPIIFIPVMLIPFLAQKDWRACIRGLAVSAAVCVIIELPFLITDPSTAFAYLSYHADRGIQIESVAGGCILFLNDFVCSGLASVQFGYGSDNVIGSFADTMAPLITGLVILIPIFMLWMLVRIYRAHIQDSRQLACLVALIIETTLLLFVAVNKVYSAQYAIWILLLLPLTMLNCFNKTTRNIVLVFIVPYGLLCLLNGYTYLNCGLPQMDPVAVVVIFLRNLCHLILTGLLIYLCWQETGTRRSSKITLN